MALEKKAYTAERTSAEAVAYSTSVPMHLPYSVAEHTLVSNDALSPATITNRKPHNPGNAAAYILTADGSHTPTFSTFKKMSTSGNWVATLGTINLVTFFFDGVNYWYSIIQEA